MTVGLYTAEGVSGKVNCAYIIQKSTDKIYPKVKVNYVVSLYGVSRN